MTVHTVFFIGLGLAIGLATMAWVGSDFGLGLGLGVVLTSLLDYPTTHLLNKLNIKLSQVLYKRLNLG